MKILKKAKPIKVKCPLCRCKFSYKKDDILYGWGIGYYVKCPECKGTHHIRGTQT